MDDRQDQKRNFRRHGNALVKASRLNRTTKFTAVEKADGIIYVQGIEYGRAFNFVIHEATGRMTVAVSLDGL